MMKGVNPIDLRKEYRIRHYRPGDENGVLELLDLVFDGWPRMDLSCTPLDHWRWKYEDNPLKKIYVTVAESDHKIVGCQHGILHRIKIGDEIVNCSNVADLAVHPNFRRMGIWNKMNEIRGEMWDELGVKLSYWMTGNPIVIEKYIDVRPNFPNPLINLVNIRDIDLHLEKMPMEREWFIKLGFKTVRTLNDLGNRFRRSLSKNPDVRIEDIEYFDEGMDRLWREVSDQYKIIIERKRDYLNWRYCDPRAGDFTVKQAEEHGQVQGYVVLKINRYREDYPVGFIVDLLTVPNRPDVTHALISDAVGFFDEHKTNIVNSLVVKAHPYEDLFKRHGFVDSRINVRVFFNTRDIGEKFEKLKNTRANSGYFSWGDHDTLPITGPE